MTLTQRGISFLPSLFSALGCYGGYRLGTTSSLPMMLFLVLLATAIGVLWYQIKPPHIPTFAAVIFALGGGVFWWISGDMLANPLFPLGYGLIVGLLAFYFTHGLTLAIHKAYTGKLPRLGRLMYGIPE